MSKIQYTTIESSNIVGYYYDESEKKLYIKFKNEREYYYSNVSKEEFDALFEKGSSFGKKLYATIVNKKNFEEIW